MAHETFFKSQMTGLGESRDAKRQAIESEWVRVKRAVRERDKYCCRACGERGSDPHHIKPRSLGRVDSTANVCCLCRRCHDEIKLRRLFVTGNADRRLKIARYGADGLLSDSEVR